MLLQQAAIVNLNLGLLLLFIDPIDVDYCLPITPNVALTGVVSKRKHGTSAHCAPFKKAHGGPKAVSQLLWSHKGREEWFSLGENHERRRGSPGFPARGTHRGQSCAAFFTESRMQFDGTTKLHRKSGFGLHQLRNRSNRRAGPLQSVNAV
jgi:hypothetical protein